jgi:hypothetical protein
VRKAKNALAALRQADVGGVKVGACALAKFLLGATTREMRRAARHNAFRCALDHQQEASTAVRGSWIDSWYLLVELNGISTSLGLASRQLSTLRTTWTSLSRPTRSRRQSSPKTAPTPSSAGDCRAPARRRQTSRDCRSQRCATAPCTSHRWHRMRPTLLGRWSARATHRSTGATQSYVLSQRAGLVAADRRRRAERLDR